jgi:hypothetical protein
MRTTTTRGEMLLKEKITIDTGELQQVLSCGRATAVDIGTKAGARIQIGKRVLWNVDRLKNYLDSISEGE